MTRPLQRCSVHGLHFDPELGSGCVLCRKTTSAHPQVGRWALVGMAMAALAGTAAAIAVLAGSPSASVGPAATAAAPPDAGDPGDAENPTPGEAQRDEREHESPADQAPSTPGAGSLASATDQERRALAEYDAKLAEQDRLVEATHDDYAIALHRAVRPKHAFPIQMRRAELAPGVVAQECESGNKVSCLVLAAKYRSGENPDPARAEAYTRKAREWAVRDCREGEASACEEVRSYDVASPGEHQGSAREYYEKRCESGEYADCDKLGTSLPAGGRGAQPGLADTFYRRAVAFAEPRCVAGEADACQYLALAYASGQGVRADPRKMVEYLEKHRVALERALSSAPSK